MTVPLRDCSNNYVLSYHLKGENLHQLRFVDKLLRRYDRYKVGTFWPLFDVINLQKRGEFVHDDITCVHIYRRQMGTDVEVYDMRIA
jgi:hypothetical protein